MNPLLFASLSNQRRLLGSGSAYGTARLVLNMAFTLAGIAGAIAIFIWLRMVGGVVLGSVGVFPDDLVFAHRALLIVGMLAYVGGIYVAWVAVRAFFDIADACLAISLQQPEERSVPGDSERRPRSSGDTWPEPPKPLIPVPEAPRPEDAKYMPKG